VVIGIPKEIMHGEGRVSATPETAEKLRAEGFNVLVEKGAGLLSFHKEEEYVKAGAEIVEDAAALYEQADIILKVKEPQFNTEKNLHEIDMMHKGQYLITFIHPASPANHEMVRKMAGKGIIGLTLDGVPRISRAQHMDALTSMSTCAGYKGMLIAANDLAVFMPPLFCAVGMIKPCNVLVLGAGVAGLQAIATAKRLGAVVHAADIRPDAVEQAKSLGAKIVETGVPADIAVGEGGYANALSDEWLVRERENLKETINDMEMVSKCVDWCVSVLEAQPDKNKFYFMTTPDGKLALDGEFIDNKKLKQCYWECGFAMMLMDRMYQITKEQKYLDYAKRFMEFLFTCAEDTWSYWGSGKAALGCAMYYSFTGDERAMEAAVKFIDFVVETQVKISDKDGKYAGGFWYDDEPDILLIYVDHAACFSGWVLDSISYIESKLQTMG
jgi:NAD/NADP transhydrogenase alpha subunit